MLGVHLVHYLGVLHRPMSAVEKPHCTLLRYGADGKKVITSNKKKTNDDCRVLLVVCIAELKFASEREELTPRSWQPQLQKRPGLRPTEAVEQVSLAASRSVCMLD